MYIKLGEMMSGPTHRASDLIGLGLWPGQGDLKAPQVILKCNHG